MSSEKFPPNETLEFQSLDPAQQSRLVRKAQELGLLGSFRNVFDPTPSNPEATKHKEVRVTEIRSSPLPTDSQSQESLDLQVAQNLVRAIEGGAPAKQLKHLLNLAFQDGVDFYRFVSKESRMLLFMELWRSSETDVLLQLLALNEEEPTAIEHLFSVWTLLQTNHPEDAVHYFINFKSKVMYAIQRFGFELHFPRDPFFLRLGDVAIQMDFSTQGREILSYVSPSSSEYLAAEQLIQLDCARKNPLEAQMKSMLIDAKDWQQRLALLKGFLTDVNGAPHEQKAKKEALSQFFSDILSWFPKVPEVWLRLGQLMCEFSDLVSSLPHMLEFLVENSRQFHDKDLDQALWSPFCHLPDRSKLWGFRGLAHFHCFIWASEGDTHHLYQAWLDLHREEGTDDQSFSLQQHLCDWLQLSSAGEKYLLGTHSQDIEGRLQKIGQIRLLSAPHSLDERSFEQNVKTMMNGPVAILKQLQKGARERKAWQLEWDLIASVAESSHYTHQDIDRIWVLANKLSQFDAAWRLASIMESKRALASHARLAWSVSGERNPKFLQRECGTHEIFALFSKLGKDEERFIRAYSCVGPQLPSLLVAFHRKDFKLRKMPKPHAGLVQVLKQLVAKDCCPSRLYLRHQLSHELYFLKRPLPVNLWTQTFMEMVRYFGLSTFGGDFQYLNGAMTQINMGTLTKNTEKNIYVQINRLKQLWTSEQRAGWGEMIIMASKVEPFRQLELALQLCLRLACLIYPNHVLALEACRDAGWPVGVIWDLENWIASAEYSGQRLRLGLAHRVPVPSGMHLAQIVNQQ